MEGRSPRSQALWLSAGNTTGVFGEGLNAPTGEKEAATLCICVTFAK